MRSLLILVALAGTAAAQGLPTESRAAVAPGGTHVTLTTSFGKKAGSQLRIGDAKPVAIHKGVSAGTLVVGHDKLLVALATTGKDEPFRVIVVDKTGKRGEPIAIARAGSRHDNPFAVAGTATKDGFAIFFQEVETQDPSAAHTYLALLDETGKPSVEAKEVPVPWSLAAATDNGHGYHLALIYPGDAAGMRISMVSLDPAGNPQQHPDWASPGGFISQVNLVHLADGDIHAIYRGGKGNDRILEIDVTRIGQWGSEPAAPEDHGAIGAKSILAVDGTKAVKVAR